MCVGHLRFSRVDQDLNGHARHSAVPYGRDECQDVFICGRRGAVGAKVKRHLVDISWSDLESGHGRRSLRRTIICPASMTCLPSLNAFARIVATTAREVSTDTATWGRLTCFGVNGRVLGEIFDAGELHFVCESRGDLREVLKSFAAHKSNHQ